MAALTDLTRPWEIFLVHHSHVDIGYTAPQSVIMRKQAEFIATALDYCTETDALPEGERFYWVCEGSWSIKLFLARYPERAEEFFQRVREGRIEVTGMYLQITDLFGEALLEKSLAYAQVLAAEHQFTVVTAMQNDINGYPWALPDLLAARDIRYFDIAINETRALGVRPRPFPFYWYGANGHRVLTWHGLGYMEANHLQQSYGEEWLANLLLSLEKSNYPHHALALRVAGEHHDNAPPGRWICDMIHNWNTRHEYPHLRLGTTRTWFEHLEQHWPEPFQTLHGSWCDWWADGNGSALYESALVRRAQGDLQSIDALQQAGASIDQKRLADATEAAMLFAEHTWGAWCSTDMPDHLESKAQWNTKAGYAYTAAVEAQDMLQDALRSCIPYEGPSPLLWVFNPLPYSRTDLLEVLIDDEAILGKKQPMALGKARTDEGPAFHLEDADGQCIEVSRVPIIHGSDRRPAQLVRFIAQGVAPGEWQKYRLLVDEPLPLSQPLPAAYSIENDYYVLCIDALTGGIASLQEKTQGRELVQQGEYSLNQFIYEVIDDHEGRERLCAWAGPRYDVPFRRSTPSMHIANGLKLPFGNTVIVEGGGEDGYPHIRSEITLYDSLPWVDIVNTVRKLPGECADAIYQAFPLAAVNPVTYVATPGGPIRPGLDQVSGSATDWHSLQEYFAVSGSNGTTVVASPDVPLVQVNGINTGRWQPAVPSHNGIVMSWVMNNYWFTNFPATQWGTVSYRYRIMSYTGAFDATRCQQFAGSMRQPLLGVYG